jgi:hypothetical protein
MLLSSTQKSPFQAANLSSQPCILALVDLLAGEVNGMLEEAKDAILISPAAITMAMIAREDAGSGGTDLLRSLEAPVGDALLKLLKPHAHAVHGLGALVALVGRPSSEWTTKTRTPGSPLIWPRCSRSGRVEVDVSAGFAHDSSIGDGAYGHVEMSGQF